MEFYSLSSQDKAHIVKETGTFGTRVSSLPNTGKMVVTLNMMRNLIIKRAITVFSHKIALFYYS